MKSRRVVLAYKNGERFSMAFTVGFLGMAIRGTKMDINGYNKLMKAYKKCDEGCAEVVRKITLISRK